MSFELDYTELDYIRRALSVQALDAMGQRVTEGAADAVQPDALQLVQHYPPRLSGQRYIRTDTYKRSAFAEVNTIPNGAQLAFGSHGAIQDGRRYDQYLKDERQQADIHKGRWQTLSQDADELMPMVEDALEAELVKEGFR